MFLMSVPRISDDELKRRYAHIKPVITVDGKLHRLREYTVREMRETSYYACRTEDVREQVPDDELEVWEGHDFSCLHSYGYPGVFKPGISEVLAQLSQNDLVWVKAFEIIDFPKVAADFYKTSFDTIAFNNGFHVSKVRLYIEKNRK